MDNTGSIRILIADDDAVVREGLIALINRRPDMHVVAEASDGVEAVEQFSRYQPDVALIDLRMPRMSGAEAMNAIRGRFPGARLIVLTTFDGPEDVSRAMRAGATGYLLKGGPFEELLKCIRTVHSGEPFIPPHIAAKLSSRLSCTSWDRPELQVLRLMIKGKSDQEIAVILHLSEGDAEARVAGILDKLGIRDRSVMTLMLSKQGMNFPP